jgi:hypothetical protein
MPRVHLKQVAQSSATNGQIVRYNSTTGNWEPYTPTTTTYPYKAGTALKASFTGNPKVVTITFASAFADTNYSVALGSITSGNSGFGPVVNTKTVNGFVINMMVNNVTNLIAVDWIATKHGET